VKAALLCGPCPPGACGVGDYTIRLASALNQKGIEADVISSRDLNLLGVVKHHEERNGAKFDVVHIQYPTVGFGAALAPQGLALIRSSVVTVHEASGAHILRKLALLPFSIRPKRLVFTSECEQQFAIKWVPWISRVSCVIPITSNIPPFEGPTERRLDEILHFGLIMPNKGLESVIALGELVKVSGLSFRIRIVGSCPPKYGAYFEDLKSRASTFPIIWDHELTEQQVAGRLASSSIAYLPYPDGVSERRATFKAALLNGVTVITTRGKDTPSELEDLVSFCTTPEEALVAARFLAGNVEKRTELANRARRYARRFTWDSIAEAHFALYRDIVGTKTSRERGGVSFDVSTNPARGKCSRPD
jgi:glycosyltransferase involved in cell wall biosynthesis